MLTKDELTQKLIEESNVWYNLACDEFKLAPQVIMYDFQALHGSRAGDATPSNTNPMIRYNLTLAYENQEQFFKDTVPHEVAHLIQLRLYPRSAAHGKEWRYIMERVFNVPAKRCHNYDTSNTTSRRKYQFKCEGCQLIYKVGKNLHDKIVAGSGHRCGKCRGKLIKIIPDDKL